MSTFEYNDLYLKCQETGKYHMFVFDIVNSKNMDIVSRKEAQTKMIELMNNIYETIEQIEKSSGKKILVFEEDFVCFKSNLPLKGFGFKQEPFLYGDTFGFTVYRDTIDAKTIYDIYEYFKGTLQIYFDFHLANGYYETNDYGKGNQQYFRGYCMDLLSRLHKKETIQALNKLRKKVPNNRQVNLQS